jgi:hypothetical protein
MRGTEHILEAQPGMGFHGQGRAVHGLAGLRMGWAWPELGYGMGRGKAGHRLVWARHGLSMAWAGHGLDCMKRARQGLDWVGHGMGWAWPGLNAG